MAPNKKDSLAKRHENTNNNENSCDSVVHCPKATFIFEFRNNGGITLCFLVIISFPPKVQANSGAVNSERFPRYFRLLLQDFGGMETKCLHFD